MFLDFLFIAMDLVFDPINRGIDCRKQLFVMIFGDEIVLVFSIDFDFDILEEFIAEIDRHFDHGDAIEVMEEFFRLIVNLSLVFFTQMPMTGRNFDLHSRQPPTSGVKPEFAQ